MGDEAMMEQDIRILDFIVKTQKDRIKFELIKNRKELLYKFANVEQYFNLNKKIKDFTKMKSKDIICFLKENSISFKNVYILSTDDYYDGRTLYFSQEILDNLFAHGFPSIVLFNDEYMLILGEYELKGYSPKYLLKSNKN